MWQKIKNYYHLAQAILANLIYGSPSRNLTLIGVTGTDGKTTTVHMIYEIFKNAGEKAGLVSSLGAAIGNKSLETGLHVTTPSPFELQRILRRMTDRGCKYAVLEATSHGLDQNRLAGCRFEVGVVTNVTHEHLDYHKTWKNYLAAKAKLVKNSKFAILNFDDKLFGELQKLAKGRVISYSLNNQRADFNLKKFPFRLKILGDYNYYNGLAAAAATSALGVSKNVIKRTLENFENLIGRMEEIKNKIGVKIYVDFAHTPNALEQVLKTLNSKLQTPNSKLIAVFGSAGLRDIAKRGMMGEVSGKLAHLTVITDEDPRTEDPKKIAAAIAAGCRKAGAKEFKDNSIAFNLKDSHFYTIINDRDKAIEFGIKIAQIGDVVGIFGKGHEKSMCYRKTEIPWSDQEAVKKALRMII